MSRITKGWIASAGNATASAVAATRRNHTNPVIRNSAREQAVDVVVEGEEGEPQQNREPEALPDFHGLLRDRAALHDFGEIIHQVTPIQQGNREQVEHAEAY